MMMLRALSVILVAVLVGVKAQKREGDSCVDQYTSTVGRCKPADTCESARNDFQLNGIRPTFCTYSAFGVTLVCCRDGVSILHTADSHTERPIWSDSNRQADKRRVSERNDNEFASPNSKEFTSPNTPIKQNSFVGLSYDIYEKEDTPTKKEKDGDKNENDRKGQTEDSKLLEKETEFISKVWWLKLRKLSLEQRRYAEKMINDILFYAEDNKLTSDNSFVLQSTLRCDKIPMTQGSLTDYKDLEL